MASATIAGHAGGDGKKRSSAASTRARALARNSAREGVVTISTALGILGGKRGRRRLQLAAFVQDLDAALGLLQLRVTEPGQLHAAFVQRERLFEREVAFFEFLDDHFELGDRRLEVFDGGVGHLSALSKHEACKGGQEKTSGKASAVSGASPAVLLVSRSFRAPRNPARLAPG